MKAVETNEIVKVYRGKQEIQALKGVSLSIDNGSLFTLLGQNGAGKTTFLRIISTQLLPTKGEAFVLGLNVGTQEEEIRQHITVVPQGVATYGNFTPWEYCYYFTLLQGLSKHEAEEASKKALRSLGLWDQRNRTCATLSGGERKRAVIASALASDAEVLMLDEPTSGLDALARRKVWSILRELVKRGKTILLTTHIMEEAEMVSDKVAVMHKGMIIAEGTPERIKHLSKDRFRVAIEGSLNDLGMNEDDSNTVKLGNKFLIYHKDEDEALELVAKALKRGMRAEIAPVTLEDAFVKLVGGDGD